jgi:DNA helicase-2/ATP-dependent DNA helicase PcrA
MLFVNAMRHWYLPDRTVDDMNVALQNVGESISRLAYSGHGDYQNQYCPEKVHPKEWRWFLAEILDGCISDLPSIKSRGKKLLWPEWVGNLKKYLQDIWPSLPMPGEDWNKVKNKIKSPDGYSKTAFLDTLDIVNNADNLRITTIHDVKGETFDATLLISSKNRHSPGGHFSHWLNPQQGQDEYQRFAYVACSRPKHLLVVATPQLDAQNLEKFIALGFIPRDMDS